jgi:E3 ubiquitin-protein ligase TRIP12
VQISVFDRQDEVRLDNETTTGNDDRSKAEASGTSSTSPSASTTVAATASESAEPSTSKPSNGKWHIRFSIKSTTIPSDSTIYSAIHRCELEQRKTENASSSMRNIWSSSYPINFERVWTCDNEENTVNVPSDDQGAQHGDRPGTLKRHDSSSSILSLSDDSFSNDQICDNVLRLLKALYFLYMDNHIDGDTDLENAFYSRKLVAKVNRQLEEPLIVASSCLPDWIYSLMRETPFLFPFEPRYLFIQSTSYGYSRLISRWQSLQMRNQQHLGARGGTLDDSQQQQQSMALGRVERQKVRMMRNQILESAIKMLDLFSTSSSSLEIEFVDEEGTGLGPTLEFYALASKEFCKKSLGLWRDDDDSYVSSQQQTDDTTSQRYVSAPRGLFPRPIMGDNDDSTDIDKSVKRILTLFKTLGRFVAKAMLDFRIIDMPFSVAFFDIVFGRNIPLLDLVRVSIS